MYHNNDYIYDACVALEKLTGFSVITETNRGEYDGIISIDTHSFTIESKNELRKQNKGIIFARIEEIKNKSKRPIILIAKYIAMDIANELKEKKINYLDSAGNCFIYNMDLLIYISGQKVPRQKKTNQTKAFQEAGIKIIFCLLSNLDNSQLSYREISEMAKVSIGSVSNVMKELEDSKFLLKTKNKRVLKNKPTLLERWIIAYHDVLRPRLVKKQMSFITKEANNRWQDLYVSNEESITLWGGEPGASVLTHNQLVPEKYTIYTTESWQNVGKDLKLIPDNNGNIEILQVFWNEKGRNLRIASPLLIYADLIGSGYGRNIEIAKQILENELSYIQ